MMANFNGTLMESRDETMCGPVFFRSLQSMFLTVRFKTLNVFLSIWDP